MGPQDYAKAIRDAWRGSTQSVLDACKAAKEAKYAKCLYETSNELVGVVDRSTLVKLARIGECAVFYQPGAASVLPQSWGTLYELVKLGDAELQARWGDITPALQRKVVAKWRFLKPPQMPPQQNAPAPKTLEGAVKTLDALRKAGKPADYVGQIKPGQLRAAIMFLQAIADAGKP